MMRKGNFAANVNRKTPHMDSVAWLFCACSSNNNGTCRNLLVIKLLDWHPYVRHNNMYTS